MTIYRPDTPFQYPRDPKTEVTIVLEQSGRIDGEVSPLSENLHLTLTPRTVSGSYLTQKQNKTTSNLGKRTSFSSLRPEKVSIGRSRASLDLRLG